MTNNRIIFSHPSGNANSRAVGEGLVNANILESFHTTIATYPSNIFGNLSNLPGMSEFKRRAYATELEKYSHLYPSKELGRLFALKLKFNSLITKELGRFSVDKVYQDLDMRIAKYAKKNNNYTGIYAYEDGALSSFKIAKEMGKSCYYDLPIGYWRAMRRLLGEEKDKNPDWAMTLGGFEDSQKKLDRKDEELALADRIFVASTFTKKTLEDYPHSLSPIEVIPYGFPTPNFNRQYESFKNNRKLKVLYVGGLSQRKGISYLFDAIKGLEQYIELTVVGRGNIEGCHALKKALSTSKYIPSLPHHEILELMASQDVFIFPSLFEGFGMVITEAMSQGTPVITTDRTCGPDIINNNEDGWLISSGQSLAIKEQLELILENKKLCEDVGRKARLTAMNRTWEQYAKETIQSLVS